MKRRKGLIALVIIAGILFVYIFSPLCDFATIPQKPQENSYVFDYADLIDDSDENEIRALAKKIEDSTSAEIVVVTVETLEGFGGFGGGGSSGSGGASS